MTAPRFSAILFDCDGVLVDSEPLTCGVLHAMLGEMGWDLPFDECIRRFVGKAFKDEALVIHEHTGVMIDDDWIAGFRDRRDDALRANLRAVPGAVEAVHEIAESTGLPVACVSGADRRKISMQLAMVGLDGLFGERVFSGMEVPRSKPAPDVYLAAAAALGVDPASAAVVEDSPAGVRAGLAAGATVFGFAAEGPTYQSPGHLAGLGADHVFRSMSELPGLLMGG